VGIGLRKAFGTETIQTRAFFETAIAGGDNDLRYTARAGGTGGNSITIEYVVAGNNTPLTIAVTARDIVVNVATDGAGLPTSTANDILAAVNLSLAARTLVTVAVAAANDGSGVVAAVAQTNLATGAGTPQVVYSLASAIEETSFSVWHWKDNEMSGFRGCLGNVLRTELNGSDEGRMTLTGFTGNEVFAGVGLLTASVADGVVTTFTVGTTNVRRFQVGPVAATDRIYLQIEDEVVQLTGHDYTAGTLTVVRAQLGTTGVAHANGTEIGPWVPGADQEPLDIISPIVLGSISFGGVPFIGVSFTQEVNNQLEPRLDEYGQDTLTGYRRTRKRTVTGEIRAYALQEWQSLKTNFERETVEDASIVAGGGTTSRLTIDMDRLRMNALADDGGGPEFVRGWSYQALQTTTPGNDETTFTYD
jgi:hypothetical protein